LLKLINRQLDGLRQDAERLKSRISDLEDQILEGITEVEQLEAEASTGQQQLQTFEERWAREHQELTAQYKALRVRLQAVQNERNELRATLDAATLSLYDELRAKKAGVALAPMKGGVCQICHVTIPSYKARSVDRGEGVVTCEGCGRILCSA
jgi:predicted  nucleic acid-binding Zn-ribbon protein